MDLRVKPRGERDCRQAAGGGSAAALTGIPGVTVSGVPAQNATETATMPP